MRLLLAALLLAAAPDKAADTPDLMQSLPEAGLPDGGAAYCGPVAVSNSLVWFTRHGYPTLAQREVDSPAGQGGLAALLGGPRYMRTTYTSGTSAHQILEGLERYMQDHGAPQARLSYQGTGAKIAPRFLARAGAPDPAWIARGLEGDGAVWLKLGWYTYNRQTDRYHIFAGHWVTVVGYDHQDPLRPIIHDPAPRSGPTLQHDHARLDLLQHGGQAMRGFYQVGGNLHLKSGADAGILDEAIVLRMDGRL
ncbi:MAG: hypothetical protein JWM80_5472 [Cyanobacteria bacterium RYN_339]|nr:hypothetical protein [Cyanobacteria bacterium RYN_339]